MNMGLVLSIFPGIDLLGMAFERQGYSVVRGPDPIWGGRIEDFHPPPHAFEGLIGGPPCQDFSRSRRTPPTGEGLRLMDEFIRCVNECWPIWFLMENVVGVPSIVSRWYRVQRLNLDALECGSRQHRLRCFQFGSRDGTWLVVPRVVTRGKSERDSLGSAAAGSVTCDSPAKENPSSVTPQRTCMASEGHRPDRRDWSEFCVLQGLPPDFDLPGMTRAAKYRAVGNGVPLEMGRVVSIAVRSRHVTAGVKVCACECGRPLTGKQTYATAGCRKRMERRRRDRPGVAGPGPDTTTRPQEGDQ